MDESCSCVTHPCNATMCPRSQGDLDPSCLAVANRLRAVAVAGQWEQGAVFVSFLVTQTSLSFLYAPIFKNKNRPSRRGVLPRLAVRRIGC